MHPQLLSVVLVFSFGCIAHGASFIDDDAIMDEGTRTRRDLTMHSRDLWQKCSTTLLVHTATIVAELECEGMEPSTDSELYSLFQKKITERCCGRKCSDFVVANIACQSL